MRSYKKKSTLKMKNDLYRMFFGPGLTLRTKQRRKQRVSGKMFRKCFFAV